MFWKLSLLISFIAATAAVYNVFAGTEDWGPSLLAGALVFSVVIILMVGPHVAFAALAMSVRSHRVLSGVLLVIVLAVSVSGMVALSVEVNAYLSRDRSVPGGQRMGLFLIGLAQWISVILVSAILLPVFFILKQKPEKTETVCPK